MFGLTAYRNNNLDLMDPFREFDRMADGFFSRSFAPAFRTDIRDNGDSFELKADLPGMNRDDIRIDLNEDTMTIQAQRRSEFEDKDAQGSFVRCERSFGSCSRSFDVSGIDTDHITAAYTDGVLTLTMPKRQAVVPASRRLEIQ